MDLAVGFSHDCFGEDCFLCADAGDGEVDEEDFGFDGAEGGGFEGGAEVAGGFLLEGCDEVALGAGGVLGADGVDDGAVAEGEDGDEGAFVGAEAFAGFVDCVDVCGGDDGGGDWGGGVEDGGWGGVEVGRLLVGVGWGVLAGWGAWWVVARGEAAVGAGRGELAGVEGLGVALGVALRRALRGVGLGVVLGWGSIVALGWGIALVVLWGGLLLVLLGWVAALLVWLRGVRGGGGGGVTLLRVARRGRLVGKVAVLLVCHR